MFPRTMLINTMYYDACRAAKNINQLVLVKESERADSIDPKKDEISEDVEDIMNDVAHDLMMAELNDYVTDGIRPNHPGINKSAPSFGPEFEIVELMAELYEKIEETSFSRHTGFFNDALARRIK